MIPHKILPAVFIMLLLCCLCAGSSYAASPPVTPLDTWRYSGPLSLNVSDAAYCDGKYIVNGMYHTLYSDDLINWSSKFWNNANIHISQIACGNGKIVALGWSESLSWGSFLSVFSSSDGIAWSTVLDLYESDRSSSVNLSFTNGRFFVNDNSPSNLHYRKIHTSNDGINWASTVYDSFQMCLDLNVGDQNCTWRNLSQSDGWFYWGWWVS